MMLFQGLRGRPAATSTALLLFSASVVLTLLSFVSQAEAADEKKALRAQMARMQQLQQAAQALEAEKGQLSADKTKLENELKVSRSELDRARSAVSRREAVARQELTTLQAEQGKLVQQLDDARAQVEALKASLQAATRNATQVASELVVTQSGLRDRTKALGECEAKNQSLYDLNASLVARLEKAASSTIWTGGPLTMFSRVKSENEAGELRDKLDEHRIAGDAKP